MKRGQSPKPGSKKSGPKLGSKQKSGRVHDGYGIRRRGHGEWSFVEGVRGCVRDEVRFESHMTPRYGSDKVK